MTTNIFYIREIQLKVNNILNENEKLTPEMIKTNSEVRDFFKSIGTEAGLQKYCLNWSDEQHEKYHRLYDQLKTAGIIH